MRKDTRIGALAENLRYLGSSVLSLPRAPIGAAILAASLGIFGGVKSCEHEYQRRAQVPLGFSEIHQIERDAAVSGRVIGEGDGSEQGKGMAATYYLAGSHDLCMKIFECWNISHESSQAYRAFAEELDARLNPDRKKYHYELADLFVMVPESCKVLEKKLEHFLKIHDILPSAVEKFGQAWTENHNDHYHTSFYPSMDTDGNVTIKSRQVYDYTDHSYWYHPKEGGEAARSLDALIALIPDIRLSEEIFTASRTNSGGELAAKESRKKEKKSLSADELMNIANTWYHGATMLLFTQKSYEFWKAVGEDADAWRKALPNAKDTSYRTSNSFDAGPEEYRAARKAQGDCQDLFSAVGGVLDVVQSTEQQLPVLGEKIHAFIQASKSGSKDTPRLGEEVFSLTQKLYQKNFVKGIDVDRFREGMVVLWTFLGVLGGGILGGLAGAGLELLGKNKN